ncbi:hypothetical protein N7495_007068 [Penicillium taxi]|uniref:uncharacterized protein n=1 Tax=Penicillium taxi TaxID=168475 RepID=UPI00254501A6|nr:uncharacterized protein N7495_007068 [Penicillium taxi]KAJ5895377.1 hypothetical protein N7495_007068 [Penicillium taxi]
MVDILLKLTFLCALLPSVLGITSLESIFTLKSGINKGGCDTYKSKLSTWFDESVELAKAGVQCFQDAKKGEKAAKSTLKLLLGINGNTAAKEVKALEVFMEEILEFCEGGLQLDSGKYPRLFCGSGWLEQQTWNDWSCTSTGNVKHEQVECNGDLKLEPVTLAEDSLYSRWYEAGDLVPYWSADLEQYVFEQDYNRKGYCGFTGSLAGTQSNTYPATMDICASAFKYSKNGATLGVRSAQTNTLSNLLPRSATFLHELFHLVHGTGATLDASYNLETILAALKSPKTVPKYFNLDSNEGGINSDKFTNLQLVRANPETYVFLCVAYWYTINKGYTFPTGELGVEV